MVWVGMFGSKETLESCSNICWKINNQVAEPFLHVFLEFYMISFSKFSAYLDGGDYVVCCLV